MSTLGGAGSAPPPPRGGPGGAGRGAHGVMGPQRSSAPSASSAGSARARTAGATASPSSSGPPKQARTLKQPMTLNVAESAPGGRPGVSGSGGATDAAEYARSLQRRAAAARRAEKWIDRAMEEVLDKPDFLKALGFMHAAAYAEVVHERHLNGLCGYALCGNAPAEPYRSRKRWLVSTSSRTITEREGNDDEAFCGRRCAARSAYVAAQLDTQAPWLRAGSKPITLLDDLEAAGEVTWSGRRGDVLQWVKKAGAPEIADEPKVPAAAAKEEQQQSTSTPTEAAVVSTDRNGQEELATTAPTAASITGGLAMTNTNAEVGSSTAAFGRSRDPAPSTTPAPPRKASSPPPASAPTSRLSSGGGMNSLLESLSIIERETPKAKPRAPTLNEPRLPVEPGRPVAMSSASGEGTVSPQPQPQPQSGAAIALSSSLTTALPAPPKSARAARRDASLMDTQHKSLANSVLTASRKIPVPRDAADSDAESSASEEDWARQMGWGAGPEVDALFAEASAARALADTEGGDDGADASAAASSGP